MGIKISYRLALMSIFLCFFIQAPQTAHGQDTMKNDAGGTCSALSKKSTGGLSGATDKISETLDNFMDVVIEKFQNVYSSISPAGLYHVLGLLMNVADESSKSFMEIEEGWMVKKKANKPTDLFSFNREIKKLNFNSSVLYYYPRSLGEPSSDLSFVVKHSGGLLFQENRTILYQINEKTGGRLTTYQLPENEKSQIILNTVSFSFQWFDEFLSVQNSPHLTLANGKRVFPRTMYTRAAIPYFEGNNLRAAQLNLKEKDGKRIEGMSVYIIDTFGNPLKMVDWDAAFVGLKQGGKTLNGLELFSFKLDAEIEFNTKDFPSFLRKGNDDFKSVGKTVDFKFRQRIVFCVDQSGSRGANTPSESDKTISLEKADKGNAMPWGYFDLPFYFLIADDMIGIPYLIHRVVEPLQDKESC
ncbi:hypothetical protein HMI54_004281 [Coelomomyces lativittatus]|nr:hypothetical protein HMI55_004721 [Coelomomyces lativittatus]KAJ1504749.1 hypothetical protein HMI56_001478 [Coelomomyces lativittatus]KAJ1507324.1 hypothetical protein HMI54_004281 [Coelomomyces lativittatus]